jgi:hypothetical protein
MLTRITPEMLSELNGEQKEKLKKWAKKHTRCGDLIYIINSGEIVPVWAADKEDIEYYDDTGYHYVFYKDILPLLSIGRCIQLLANSLWIEVRGGTMGFINGKIVANENWEVSHCEKVDPGYISKELIVALWESIKKAL